MIGAVLMIQNDADSLINKMHNFRKLFEADKVAGIIGLNRFVRSLVKIFNSVSCLGLVGVSPVGGGGFDLARRGRNSDGLVRMRIWGKGRFGGAVNRGADVT